MNLGSDSLSEPTITPVRREIFMACATAWVLVALQIFFSWFFSFGGTIHFTVLCFTVSYFTEGESHYWVQAGVNASMLMGAMLIWHIIGLTQLPSIYKDGNKDSNLEYEEHLLEEIARNNFPLKVILAYLAHISLYSFWRFWANVYKALKAKWDEYKKKKAV